MLASESLTVVDELSAVLSRTLRMAAGDASLSLLVETPPMLVLQMFPWNRVISVENERATLLPALARLAIHSRALRAMPAAKTAIWEKVLASEMADVSTSGVHDCTLGFPSSPRFLVDFSGLEDFDEAVLEMLVAFITTPITDQVEVRSLGKKKRIALGFSFVNCHLTIRSLRFIESFLDRAFEAHRERQYDIDLLDLSDNSMDADALSIVAQIVRKNAVVYGIEELKLNDIVADETVDGLSLDETPIEYLKILQAALGVPQVLRVPPAGQTVQMYSSISKLRRFAMKGNDLCSKPFAALGSAFRYGYPGAIDELLSSFVVAKNQNHSDEDTRECWKWLAFGLFYPRLRRSAGERRRVRKLGPLDCSAEAMETMLRTLRNPAAEFLNLGEAGNGDGAVGCGKETRGDALASCTVKNGAKIRMVSASSQGSLPRMTIQREESTELEVLYEDKHGSVCVVVPGVGLGWVEREAVEKVVGREPIEQCRYTTLDSKYDVKLVLNETEEIQPVFRRFIREIGRHLRGIDCSKCRFLDGTLQFILESCPHLEHLNLQACAFAKADADALLNALEGNLGRRLLALNLNRLLVGDAFVQRLAAILSNTEEGSMPVLQELRLHDTGIGEQALARLNSALSINRTLHSLELKKSIEHESDGAYSHLTQTFQGQALRTPVPLASKLAFLSVLVVKDSSESASSARHQLDQWLVASILQFAATQMRRRIFLNGTMRAPGRHS